jgi:hypothetical protein
MLATFYVAIASSIHIESDELTVRSSGQYLLNA